MLSTSLDAGSLTSRSDVLEVKNVGRVEIEPYAAVEMREAYVRDGRIVAQVSPSTSFGFHDGVFLNGETAIPPSGFGAVQSGRYQIARVNADDGIPEVGQNWGPDATGGKLRKDIPGGRVLRVFRLNELVLIRRNDDVIVTCQIGGQLNPGESISATAMRFDEDEKDLVLIDDADFTVLERTGLLTIEGTTRCFVKWLDQFSGWVVIGYVC